MGVFGVGMRGVGCMWGCWLADGLADLSPLLSPTKQSTADPLWDERYCGVYTDPALDVPWFAILGECVMYVVVYV